MNILDEYEALPSSVNYTKKQVELIVKATDYINELVAPYGWTLKASRPGAAFEDKDGNYFSFDALAWKEVRKILELMKDKDKISRTSIGIGGGTGPC